jgi:hypothetical protein
MHAAHDAHRRCFEHGRSKVRWPGMHDRRGPCAPQTVLSLRQCNLFVHRPSMSSFAAAVTSTVIDELGFAHAQALLRLLPAKIAAVLRAWALAHHLPAGATGHYEVADVRNVPGDALFVTAARPRAPVVELLRETATRVPS